MVHYICVLGCVGMDSIFSSLHKAKIDNMKEYIEKKKQRMEGKKRGKEQGEETAETPGEHSPQCESPPAKVAKSWPWPHGKKKLY